MSTRYWSLPGVRLESALCPRQLLLTFIMLLLASAAIWLSAWHWLSCLLLNLFVPVLVVLDLRRRQRCADGRVEALEFDGCDWRLLLEDGRQLSLLPEPDWLLCRSMVALRFQVVELPGRSYSLWRLASSLTPEERRRLQLALRYGAGSRMVSRASGASSG